MVLCDMIPGLTRQCYTANSTIEAIYDVNRQQASVTNIINGEGQDMKNGTLNSNL
jgi:hypothetical protein